jgi:choline dehydrogenase
MAQPGVDAIVVGGGTAGSVVAGRLVEAGLRVTVLEAGPDYGAVDSGRWPDDLRRVSASIPAHHDWGYSGRGAGGQELIFDRARVIGGCSSHNGCALSVGWGGDYDRWAASGVPGWSADELGPVFGRATERMRVQRFGRDEVQPFQRAFLDSAVAAGIPETDDLDDLGGTVGCGLEPMNVVDGIRWNAAFAYLDPVRDRDELEVIGDTLVDRVLLEGDRAVGVRAVVAGAVREFRSDMVVLSGGAYGSPEILLRSGIGDPNELRRAGVEAIIDLPGVGRNLHDQPALQLEFVGTERLARELGAFAEDHGWLPEEQTMAKLASPESEGPYDLHVYPWVERDDALASGWRCVIPVALLTPRSRGRLRLCSTDPQQRAELDHGYLAEAADVRALLPGVRWALERARSDLLTPYLGEPLRLPPAPGNDTSLGEWIRSTHGHYWHPAGTCRMGPGDDPSSVVDGGGGVHRVEGLRVADASIFPAIPRSTPALPTVVVGERVADAILGMVP